MYMAQPMLLLGVVCDWSDGMGVAEDDEVSLNREERVRKNLWSRAPTFDFSWLTQHTLLPERLKIHRGSRNTFTFALQFGIVIYASWYTLNSVNGRAQASRRAPAVVCSRCSLK